MSLLLSLIFIVTTCGISPVYGGDKIKIDLEHLEKIGLVEGKPGGLEEKVIAKDAEEATLRWNISKNAGKYELIYYTDSISENNNDTTKVVLSVDVKSTKANVMIKMYSSKGVPIAFEGYKEKFPYQGEIDNNGASEFAYVADLRLPHGNNSVAASAKELNLALGKNLKIRMMTDGTQLTVWTNQVNKGYITDFNLYYEGQLQESKGIFPGLSESEVSSIHLERGNGLQNRQASIDASEGERAGSHPGIKVTFKRPLIRNEKTNRYEVISAKQGKALTATLNLQTKLEPKSSATTHQTSVTFDLSPGASIKGVEESSEIKTVSMEGENHHQMSLYFVKDLEQVDEVVRQHVISWPILEESMVIGGELTLTGDVPVGKKYYNIITGNVALKTGYTYLAYTPEQSTVGEVTLQITPYKYAAEVTYEIYVVNGNTHLDINQENCLFGAYKFTYDPLYPERKLEISIPTGRTSTFMIRGVFDRENNQSISQRVYYYINGSQVIIKPYTPQIKEVNNIYAISQSRTQVEAAGFDIAWSLPSEEKLKETLKGGKTLYYELFLYDSKKSNKALIAIFKLSLEGSIFKVEPMGRQQGEVFYDEERRQFIAKEVILKDFEKESWEKIQLPSGYEYEAKYPTLSEENNVEGLSYSLPNSFYLGMRSVLQAETGLKTSATISQLYPITLDQTTQVVPAPTQSKVEQIAQSTDLEFFFENVSIETFVSKMLSPAKWVLKESTENEHYPGKYQVYLYQAHYLEDKVLKENEVTEEMLQHFLEKPTEIDKFYVAEGTYPQSAEWDLTKEKEALEALRQGKVVQLTLTNKELKGGWQHLSLKGLDPNQAYYVRVQTVLESQRINKNTLEYRKDSSALSKVFSFTTTTTLKPMEPGEKVLPTPEAYLAKVRDNYSGILTWRDPHIGGDEEVLSYEIIRTTEQQIESKWLKRGLKVSDILKAEEEKQATDFKKEDYTKQIVNGEPGYQLLDETLRPNTIYYYYIRTITKENVSEWIMQPITTDNIETPKKLEAFNITKTSVDLSFLAKIIPDSLYKEFDFEIAIKEEGKTKWEKILASSLKELENHGKSEGQGAYYYSYRVRGLTPGKRYTLKICVIDKTKGEIEGHYPQSLYTDTLVIRTIYDEEEQDKQDQFEAYLQDFDQRLEGLGKKPYWTLEEGHYKYKTSYLTRELPLTSRYTLVSEAKDEANYYMPWEIWATFNEGTTPLEIKLGDMEVVIRPGTLSNHHLLCQEANQQIAYHGMKDYQILLTVSKEEELFKVNGQVPLSERLKVDISLVYIKQEDNLLEAEIIEALEHIQIEQRQLFITQLEKEITYGHLEQERLQGLINIRIEEITALHQKEIRDIMTYHTKKIIPVEYIEKPILLSYKSDQSEVRGYYYEKQWLEKTVWGGNSIFCLEMTKLGSYIFTGKAPMLQNLPHLAPYQDFINTYQLFDYLEIKMPELNNGVSKEKFYQILARIMGNNQGLEATSFLKSKGFKLVNQIGYQSPIRQDEGLYLIMQAYEKLHQRKVSTIYISNKQIVQNIGAFQPVYRDSIYAAVALNVVVPTYNRILPSQKITGQQLITMLYQIEQL